MTTKTTAKKPAKKAPIKTQKTTASVAEFIAAVENEGRRKDAEAIDAMLREVTGEEPAMWGPSIIGYGSYTLTNSMGQAEWPKIGFSPRKSSTVLYIVPQLLESDPLMQKLGKYKTGKTCLYLNKLTDVDREVLLQLIRRSWDHMTEKHG